MLDTAVWCISVRCTTASALDQAFNWALSLLPV